MRHAPIRPREAAARTSCQIQTPIARLPGNVASQHRFGHVFASRDGSPSPGYEYSRRLLRRRVTLQEVRTQQ
jgi:hypothetical protein